MRQVLITKRLAIAGGILLLLVFFLVLFSVYFLGTWDVIFYNCSPQAAKDAEQFEEILRVLYSNQGETFKQIEEALFKAKEMRILPFSTTKLQFYLSWLKTQSQLIEVARHYLETHQYLYIFENRWEKLNFFVTYQEKVCRLIIMLDSLREPQAHIEWADLIRQTTDARWNIYTNDIDTAIQNRDAASAQLKKELLWKQYNVHFLQFTKGIYIGWLIFRIFTGY